MRLKNCTLKMEGIFLLDTELFYRKLVTFALGVFNVAFEHFSLFLLQRNIFMILQKTCSTQAAKRKLWLVYVAFLTFAPLNSFAVNGNVGIGTASPTSKLEVYSNATAKSIYLGQWDTDGTYNRITLNGRTGTNYNFLSGDNDPNLFINRPAGQSIYFRMNNADQMILNSSGNLGIGLTSPVQKLEVNGNIRIYGTTIFGAGSNSTYGSTTIDGSKNGWSGINFLQGSTNAGTLMIHPSGYGGMFLPADNAWNFYYLNGVLQYPSDGRLKTAIRPIDDALSKVLRLKGVFYRWRDPKKDAANGEMMGFIAQDVEPIFPVAVSIAPAVGTATGLPGGTKSLAALELLSPIVEAIKEFHAKWLADHQILEGFSQALNRQARGLTEVGGRLARLEAENARLRQENDEVKNYLCAKDPAAKICK